MHTLSVHLAMVSRVYTSMSSLTVVTVPAKVLAYSVWAHCFLEIQLGSLRGESFKRGRGCLKTQKGEEIFFGCFFILL